MNNEGISYASVMSRPKKTPDSPKDRDEWVLVGPEESPARGGGRDIPYRQSNRNPMTAIIGIAFLLLSAATFASLTLPILAQRPWVGIDDQPQILQGAIAGRAMKVRVAFTNSGRSPAFNIYIAASLETGAPAPASAPALAQCAQNSFKPTGAVIFPDNSYSIIVGTRQDIDDDTAQEVIHGVKAIYLVGCVEYDDGIWWWHWTPRRTNFCRILIPDTVGSLGVLGSFADCPTGNSAD